MSLLLLEGNLQLRAKLAWRKFASQDQSSLPIFTPGSKHTLLRFLSAFLFSFAYTLAESANPQLCQQDDRNPFPQRKLLKPLRRLLQVSVNQVKEDF